MAYTKKEYLPGAGVDQAQAEYLKKLENKPGEYVSGNQSRLDAMLTQLHNRKPFQYDSNSDALYRQYKDQYVRLGRQAMMDTMGRASALTGGYGNSYAQTAGQQTYQNYLQSLNDKIPELYALALEKYRMEGEALEADYDRLLGQEKMEYDRYRDALADWNGDVQRLYQQYINERSYDYGLYRDEQDFAYEQYRDEVADSQWQSAFAYQQQQNQIAYDQWLQEFEYQKQQDELAYQQWLQEFQESQRRYEQSKSSGSSRGSSGRSGSSAKATGEDTKVAQNFVENMLNNAVSSRFDPERVINSTNALTDDQKKEAQSYLKTVLAAGRMK